MKAKEAKKRIDALKTAGIQKSALAKKMGMSNKVFSTRTSKGNWTDGELVQLEAFLNQYKPS